MPSSIKPFVGITTAVVFTIAVQCFASVGVGISLSVCYAALWAIGQIIFTRVFNGLFTQEDNDYHICFILATPAYTLPNLLIWVFTPWYSFISLQGAVFLFFVLTAHLSILLAGLQPFVIDDESYPDSGGT